jgi:hypothetical protein
LGHKNNISGFGNGINFGNTNPRNVITPRKDCIGEKDFLASYVNLNDSWRKAEFSNVTHPEDLPSGILLNVSKVNNSYNPTLNLNDTFHNNGSVKPQKATDQSNLDILETLKYLDNGPDRDHNHPHNVFGEGSHRTFWSLPENLEISNISWKNMDLSNFMSHLNITANSKVTSIEKKNLQIVKEKAVEKSDVTDQCDLQTPEVNSPIIKELMGAKNESKNLVLIASPTIRPIGGDLQENFKNSVKIFAEEEGDREDLVLGKKKPSVCEGVGEGLEGLEGELEGGGVDGKEGKEGNVSKSQGEWSPGKGEGGGPEEGDDDKAPIRNYMTI